MRFTFIYLLSWGSHQSSVRPQTPCHDENANLERFSYIRETTHWPKPASAVACGCLEQSARPMAPRKQFGHVSSASKRTMASVVGFHHLASTTFSSNAFIKQRCHHDLLICSNSSITLLICCSIWTKPAWWTPCCNKTAKKNLSRNAASTRLGRRHAIEDVHHRTWAAMSIAAAWIQVPICKPRHAEPIVTAQRGNRGEHKRCEPQGHGALQKTKILNMWAPTII